MIRNRAQRNKAVTIDGVTYASRTAACRELNITYDYVVKRMQQKKESFEDAVVAMLRNRGDRNGQRLGQKKTVSYAGTEYRSLRALCNSLGIKYTTIVDRVTRGKSIEDAIAESLNPHNTVTVNNKAYPTLAAAASANKVSVARVRRRMVKHGYTPEQAILDVKKSRRSVTAKKEVAQPRVNLMNFLKGMQDRL